MLKLDQNHQATFRQSETGLYVIKISDRLQSGLSMRSAVVIKPSRPLHQLTVCKEVKMNRQTLLPNVFGNERISGKLVVSMMLKEVIPVEF